MDVFLAFLASYWVFSLLFVAGAAVESKYARTWWVFVFAPMVLPMALGMLTVGVDEKDLQGSTKSSTLPGKKETNE